MTEENKYSALLKEIGALLQQKNDRIMFQEFELSTLRKNLKDAEKQIEKLKEGKKHGQLNN